MSVYVNAGLPQSDSKLLAALLCQNPRIKADMSSGLGSLALVKSIPVLMVENAVNGTFAIDADAGVITINDSDDISYETATSHTLMVNATNQSRAATNQTVTVNVVGDEGDNPHA